MRLSKTLGQIGFEQYEAVLAGHFGFTDRLGWEHINDEHKLAWEAAATAIVDQLVPEESSTNPLADFWEQKYKAAQGKLAL